MEENPYRAPAGGGRRVPLSRSTLSQIPLAVGVVLVVFLLLKLGLLFFELVIALLREPA